MTVSYPFYFPGSILHLHAKHILVLSCLCMNCTYSGTSFQTVLFYSKILYVFIHSPEANCTKNSFEPVRDKTNNLGFQPGLTQTGLYSYRRQLQA